MAQGGIAVVMDAADSFEDHIHDTLTAGAGLCHESVVNFVVSEGPERVQELIRWGWSSRKETTARRLYTTWARRAATPGDGSSMPPISQDEKSRGP